MKRVLRTRLEMHDIGNNMGKESGREDERKNIQDLRGVERVSQTSTKRAY